MPAMTSHLASLKKLQGHNREQLFKSLFGLEVSPRMSREAANFWKVIREQDGVSARDKIWSGLLPTPDDLLDPENFLKSTEVPDDLSGLQ